MSQYCISCGAQNQDNAKFCKSCGQKLVTEESEKIIKEERIAREQKLKEEKELAEKEKYASIGGWLMFFAIILVLGNISWLAYIVNTYAGDDFTSTIETLYMQGYTEQVSYLNMLVAVELISYFFVLLFTINFFMKSPITRTLMIIYSIIMILRVPIFISLLSKINPEMSQYTNEIAKMIGSTFWVIVWLLYFIFSIRVKKTFVAKDGNEPENSLIITIIFAMLIPVYFGYKHYDTVSNLSKLSNNSEALFQKAKDLQDAKKYEEAVPYLSKAAELGSSKAMALLCLAYESGNGVEKNLFTAKEWCQEAFDNTSDNELKRWMAEDIGNIYFEQDNFNDAKVWYTKSIDIFSTKEDKSEFAQRVADKYFDAKHYTTSAYWYKVAVDYGDKNAMFRLAYSYGEQKLYNEAIKYYKQYITNTDWDGAMQNLGSIYKDIKDYEKAIYWLKKAIEKGNKAVYFNLAYSYNMLNNEAEAIKWYMKSIEQDKEAVSMHNLGIIYQNQGDYSKAEYWNSKAKEAGYKQ